MRTWALVQAAGTSKPRQYPTRLQAHAALVRAGDPGRFVAVMDTADHAVLAADGPRALALRLLGKAANTACPEHGAAAGQPCGSGPSRLCPDRMEAAGMVAYTRALPVRALPIDRLEIESAE